MNVLQITAHPDLTDKSFTHSLAAAYRDGVRASGRCTSLQFFNLFEPISADFDHQALVKSADRICFAWPCWWEMPPAVLVNYLQTVFVKGFAFDLQGDRMVPKLSIPVTCLISMGQQKQLSTTNLSEAMRYCGLEPTFCVFDNVGPRLTPELAGLYRDLAYRQGKSI